MASLFTCLPKDEEAPVCIIPPLIPKLLKFSIKPTAVKGLTTPQAACPTGTLFVISKTY